MTNIQASWSVFKVAIYPSINARYIYMPVLVHGVVTVHVQQKQSTTHLEIMHLDMRAEHWVAPNVLYKRYCLHDCERSNCNCVGLLGLGKFRWVIWKHILTRSYSIQIWISSSALRVVTVVDLILFGTICIQVLWCTNHYTIMNWTWT